MIQRPNVRFAGWFLLSSSLILILSPFAEFEKHIITYTYKETNHEKTTENRRKYNDTVCITVSGT